VRRSFRLEAFGAPLVAVSEDLPVPTGRGVLLRTLVCGVCHSDLHIMEGGYDLGHGRKPL